MDWNCCSVHLFLPLLLIFKSSYWIYLRITILPRQLKKNLFGTEQWHGEPYSMVRVFPCSLSDRTGTASRIPKCSMLHVTGAWLVYLISVQVLPLSAPRQGTLKYPTKLIFLLLHLSRDGVMHNSRTLERTCSSLFGSRTRLNDRTEPSELF